MDVNEYIPSKQSLSGSRWSSYSFILSCVAFLSYLENGILMLCFALLPIFLLLLLLLLLSPPLSLSFFFPCDKESQTRTSVPYLLSPEIFADQPSFHWHFFFRNSIRVSVCETAPDVSILHLPILYNLPLPSTWKSSGISLPPESQQSV